MTKEKIPGELGWPITGDKTVEFARYPIDFIESRMKRHSSRMFCARVLNKPHIFVCSSRGVKEMLVDKRSSFHMAYKDFGYMHALFGDIFIFDNDDEAYRVRDLVKELFHIVHCDNYLENIKESLYKSLADLDQSSSLDVYEFFKDLMTKVCLKTFLGVCDDEYEQYKEIARLHWHGLISVPLNVKVKGWSSSYGKAEQAKEALLLKIREQLHSDQSESRFIQLIREAKFENEEQACNHILLFISSVIPKAMSSLMTSFVLELQGDEKKRMRYCASEDEIYLERLLLEVKRLYPPFYGGRRIATKDVIIDGHEIPKGYYVAYITKYANRDGVVFEQPDKFNPNRWENREKSSLIWTFGGGDRCCIGVYFIDKLQKMIAQYLLDHFDWRILSDKIPPYKSLPVARPKEVVPVSFVSRMPVPK